MLSFKVTKKYQRGPEQTIGQFAQLDDAKMFIAAKLKNDSTYKVEASYQLYDFDELIETMSEGNVSQGDSSSSSQGSQQTSSQVFNPSPLQMSPRPAGMPPSSFKDLLTGKSKDDEDKNK